MEENKDLEVQEKETNEEMPIVETIEWLPAEEEETSTGTSTMTKVSIAAVTIAGVVVGVKLLYKKWKNRKTTDAKIVDTTATPVKDHPDDESEIQDEGNSKS